MANLEQYTQTGWVLSPPKKNPDDLTFDELEEVDDPEEDEDDDDLEEDEEDEDEDEDDDLAEEDDASDDDPDEEEEEDDEDEDDDDTVGGEAGEPAAGLDDESGERLIEEVERFLRDQGPA